MVAGSSVVQGFNDLKQAKEVLSQVGQGSRFILEVRNGEVVSDPHQIAGQSQTPENGFNKHWSGWDDINRMIDAAGDYGK